MKLPKLSRKRLGIVLGAILLLFVLACGTLLSVNHFRQKNTTEEQHEDEGPNPYAPTDYYAPTVEELKSTYPSPANQYTMLIQYGYLKESVDLIDQSIAFYEAAIEVAPDEASRNNTMYRIYYIAKKNQKSELAEKYRNLLGDDWIRQLEQTPRSESEEN